MGNTLILLENAQVLLEHGEALIKIKGKAICDAIPELICVLCCVWNLAKPPCVATYATVMTILQVSIVSTDVAQQAISSTLESLSLGNDKAIYGFEYSKATYNDLQAHNQWNYKALTNINKNIQSQHTSMRQHLQDRHSAMEKNIGEDIGERRNALG